MNSDEENAKPKRPWQEVAREAQQYRDSTIAAVQPELPTLPHPLPKNVTAIAGQVLSDREEHITSLSVNSLLDALAGRGIGERLLAVEVVNAFLRRAALAQKLVSYFCFLGNLMIEQFRLSTFIPGKLCHRAAPQASPRTRPLPGRLLRTVWNANRASPWSPYFCQGACWDERFAFTCFIHCLMG